MFNGNKVYISGKITGLVREEAETKFKEAAKWVEANNGLAINPMEINVYNPEWKWEDYMKEDLYCLLQCNAILLLPCYKDSKGAKVELAVARSIDIPVFFFEDYY